MSGDQSMDASASTHPSDQTLRAYGVGKLYGNLADTVHSHLIECGECRQRVAELSDDTFLVRLREAQAPADAPAHGQPRVRDQSLTGGMPSAVEPLSIGSIPPGLAEHPDYEVLGELGRGGMGVVYLARNKLMGRKEVLKVVSRDLMDRRGVLDRFLREIRNAAQLHHTNIVTAYSAFRAGENIVFAMEYVEGHDLAQLVKGNGPLAVAHACNFINQAALGLQYAHEKGMVHRDIKPSNLILARHGKKPVVKILDFGLAKATREGPVDKGLTQEGQMLGTPDYIAPEQSLDATKADIRADIYSLGCTLYYLLSGGPPFGGTSLYEVLQAHHSMEAQPLNLPRPEVPIELAAVVAKMMSKDPVRRFQTPGGVAQALKPFYRLAESAPDAAKTEVSLAGQPPPVERVAPPAPVAHSPQSPATPATPPVVPARRDSFWRSLVSLDRERSKSERLEGATPFPLWPPPPWIWPIVAGVALLGLLIWWAPGVVKLKTADGTIVVENVPADAVLEIDGDKLTITPVKGEPVKIEAPPGKHYVVVRRGADMLLGERVVLESGKSYSLSVRKVPLKDAVLVLEDLPADATVELDGQKVPLAAVAGQPLKIAAQPGRHVVVVKQGDEVLLAEGVTLESRVQVKRVILRKEPLVARADAPAPPARGPESKEAAPPPALKANAPRPLPVRELTSRTTGMKLLRIESGEFMMGSPPGDQDAENDEKPQHKVRISPFFLGKTEVTEEQYQSVTGNNPSWFSRTGGGNDRVGDRSTGEYPVQNVSWFDAITFCNALSEKDGLKAYYSISESDVKTREIHGTGYRLPTEAEWEYSCRARTKTMFSFGDDPSELGNHAWYSGNSAQATHPVGLKRANDFGLDDMHGNVWEWCFDWYSDKYYSQSPEVDPRGPEGAAARVLRGGSWGNDPRNCRSAGRPGRTPDERNVYFGFRVARGQSGTEGAQQAGAPSVAVTPSSAALPSAEPKTASRTRAGAALSERSRPLLSSRSTGMKLLRIEGGEFMMGSPSGDQDAEDDEKPQHKVRISSFYLGKTEVTQEQYEAVMGSNPSWFSRTAGGTDQVAGRPTGDRPVENVSWLDAIKFCNALSEKDGLKAYYNIAGNDVGVPEISGPGYRLPTEGEWEYSCRARSTAKFSFGDDPSKLEDHGWCSGNSGQATHPVGLKGANDFGLYDMHGNVWEWCFDRYRGKYYGQSPEVDPQGPGESGAAYRLIRGGSWNFLPRICRSAIRYGRTPGLRIGDLGFRVARVQSGR
jgi:formylglycine-generating enzyme required for sulfatase activity/serine/threonine protein kinase